MRIGINALFRMKPSGVANYICNLVYHLSKADQKNEYVVFTTEENKEYFPVDQDNFKILFFKFKTNSPVYRRIWEQIYLPRLARSYKMDLLHCPMNVLPVRLGVPTIVTIIDTQYFQNPEHFSFLRKNYLKFMMHRSLDKADGIITISESVKKEMGACFNLNGRHVRVIHFGLDPCFRVIHNISMIDRVKQKYGIQGKYILFPGYPHYRKNIPRLIAAFAQVLESLPETYTLVIAGEMGTDDSDITDIKKALNRYGIKNNVLFTGYIPGICLGGHKEELSMTLLMNGAELLVYPSLYEGFGLPVIEAMACATPVLTSAIPVMNEVAGNAAIFVNPYHIEDIAHGIFQGVTDELLRQKLVRKGLDRARNFSWGKNADSTLAYYEEVYQMAEKEKNR